MSDLISRQDAIDALKNIPIWWDDEEGLIDPEDAVSEIKNLPSAQQWIPVTERLPATKKDVLIQFYSNQAVGYVDDDEWYINSGGGWFTDLFPDDEHPLAWMPLPEPNKEKQE